MIVFLHKLCFASDERKCIVESFTNFPNRQRQSKIKLYKQRIMLQVSTSPSVKTFLYSLLEDLDIISCLTRKQFSTDSNRVNLTHSNRANLQLTLRYIQYSTSPFLLYFVFYILLVRVLLKLIYSKLFTDLITVTKFNVIKLGPMVKNNSPLRLKTVLSYITQY